MRPPSRIGSYELTGRLGEGGAGAVFLARHPQLGYEVAIKVPLGGVGTSQRHRERFAREADALGKLRHPGLVDVVDRGLERGQPWFAMRRVVGQDLSARLEERVLSESEAFDLATQLADAIGAAHAVGVLHRDLKPDNVIRTQEGRYVVTDFGLAKDLEVERSVELSKTGASLGTPGYWAPEQAVGQPTSPATDVYGIGATVYAALTGEPPIEAESFLEAVLAAKKQAPKSFSAHGVKAPRLEPIVRKCLEKDPAKRFPDLASLRDALDLASMARVRSGPSPWLVVGVLSAALVAGSVLTGLLFLSEADPGPADPSPAASPEPRVTLTTPTPTLSPGAPSPGTLSPPVTPPESVATAPELAAEGRRLIDEGEIKQGMARLNEAWIRGDLDSGMLLADIHHEGRGVEPDRIVARDLYRRAADRGHGPAMIALGRSLHLRSPAEARTWFRQGLEAGEAGAGYLGLADVARLRARDDRQLQSARDLYAKAGKAGAGADAGYGLALTLVHVPEERAEGLRILRAITLQAQHPRARIALARLLSLSPKEEDRREGVRLLREGCERDQGACWAQLGVLAQRGDEFVEQDPRAAMACFAKAVKLGAVEGMLSMARALPDDKEGEKHLRRAVALEEPRAQLELGRRELRAGHIQEGLALIQEAGKAQLGQALAYLAEFYEQGKYVKANLPRSDKFLERAASAGDATACHNIALQYRYGRRRERNLVRAEHFFGRAATQGLTVSYDHYADLLMERGATAEAVGWYQRGVQADLPVCMLSLGNLLVAGKKVERDVKAALSLFVRGAELGHANCAHMGAMMMERGIGTEGKKKDWVGAARLYTQAAEAGDAASMLAIAEILADGRGVKPEPEASEEWYRKALKAASPPGEALYERGTFYAKGSGLPHNPSRAAALFKRAKEVGHAEASFQYALFLCEGKVIPKDLSTGIEVFTSLAEQGHAGASLNLGKCYATGVGVPKNLKRARELMTRAANAEGQPDLAKLAREALANLDAGKAQR